MPLHEADAANSEGCPDAIARTSWYRKILRSWHLDKPISDWESPLIARRGLSSIRQTYDDTYDDNGFETDCSDNEVCCGCKFRFNVSMLEALNLIDASAALAVCLQCTKIHGTVKIVKNCAKHKPGR